MLSLVCECFGDEVRFRSIVAANTALLASIPTDLIEGLYKVFCWKAKSRFAPQDLPAKVVVDDEYADARAVFQGIAHKVHRPVLVWAFRLLHRLWIPCRQVSLVLSPYAHSELAVDPQHTFSVPFQPFVSDPS